MKLRSVELIGFKSFAKRTKINFTSGITEIVGPNGSGKSNIIEAIRWALGEQSAKNLRSSRMTDVIFSGSQSHPALNRAKVVLDFDNRDHFINVNYTEIQVARIVYRDGTNNYYLNGKACRLRDIRNLFMNTGIGNGSFSIISQGRVAQIFKSKPVDRRFIIETVAGIYKYRSQKNVANDKLAGVNNNLTRLSDLNYELGQRRHSLDREQKVARKYLAWHRRVNHLDVQRLLIRDVRLSKKQVRSRQDHQRVKVGIRQVKSQINRSHSRVQTLKSALDKALKQYQLVQEAILKRSKQLDTLSNQQSLGRQQIQFWKKRIDRNRRNVNHHYHLITRFKDSQSKLRANQRTTSTRIKRLSQIIDQFKGSSRLKLNQNYQKKLIKLRSAYIDLVKQLTRINGQITNYNHNELDSKRRQDQIEAQLNNVKQMVRKAERQNRALDRVVHKLKRSNRVNDQRIIRQQGIYQKLNQRLGMMGRQYNNRYKQLQLLRIRMNGIKRMLASHSNLRGGSRNLLNHQARFSGILGPVARFLKVPEKYVRAVETTLKLQLQQIVVDNSRTARRIVNFMSDRRLGRVTLLPLNDISKRWISPELIQRCRQISGFIAVGSHLVEMPTKLSIVKEHLLGNVLIASNISAAIKISQVVHHRYRVVTLDGNVVNAGGAITGGQGRYRYRGLLSQKIRVAQIKHSITELRDQVRHQKIAGTKLEQRRTRVTSRLVKVRSRVNRDRQNLILKARLKERSKDELTNYRDVLNKQRRTLNNPLNKRSISLTELHSRQGQIQRQLKRNQQIRQNVHQRLTKATQQMAQITKRYQNYRERLIKVQDQKNQINSELKSVIDRIRRADQARVKGTQIIDHLKLAVERTVDQVNQHRSVGDLPKAIDQLSQRKLHYQKRVEPFRHRITSLNSRMSHLQNRLIALRSQDAQIQLGLRGLIRKRHEVEGVLYRKYEVSVKDLKTRLPETSLYTVSSKLFQAQKQLRALGPVSVNSIQRFKKVNRRYRFLTKQINDLITSKHQLITTMNQMNSRIKVRFKRTFNQVNRAFQITYAQIFRGGKAKLKLLDPRHLLTTGINILAQPPGKRYRNMELLSGGERALTAIALLFAILRVKPAPFCILDEAESALDAVNINRFGDYMRKLKTHTQFIVITHRKTTMLYADHLYGVTMQDSGISKVISANLQRAKTER